jgi:hypothetical protein
VRPASLLAVAVSALVGVVCGVGGGLLLNQGGSFADPLGLGVPLHDEDCSGQTLLLVGWGSAPSLASGITEDPDHARYLDTEHSCDTAWPLDGHQNARYVAYVGPFRTRQAACALRMTSKYKGDLVTNLADGNTDTVECACYLPVASRPLLRQGMETSDSDGIWIRSLQKMLADLGYSAPDRVTGVYDNATVTAVSSFQADQGIPPNGVMNPTTWGSLVTHGCKLYRS